MLRLRFALPLALALASGTVAAQQYTTLEERMTGAEFKAAGLDKLSAAELAALNAWLQKQAGRTLVATPAAAAPMADRVGFDDAPVRREISSRIVGEFRGWSGGTEFVLENGQVWRQSEAGELTGIAPLQNPKVFIRPGMIGGWSLQVEGYNSRVKVKRIR